MNGTFYLFCACFVLFASDLVLTEKLYAASVHWRPSASNGTSKTNEIILSYKLIWQQKPLPFCPVPNNGTLCYFYTAGTFPATIANRKLLPHPRWQGYTWRCTGGCVNTTTISDLSSLYYTDVGTFHDVSWEAAMERVIFTFGSNDDLSNIRIGFFDSSGVMVTGYGEEVLNMAVRNDTGRANISPAINPLPYYRVPLGCSITISLFPFDGDGDHVHCQWQHRPTRGTNISTIVLNQVNCELHVHADPKQGFKAGNGVTISLYAEDFSTQPVKLSKVSNDITTGPFSRTPVLLYLYVSPPTSNCNPGPDFIETGTLPPNSVQSYPLPLINAKLPFKIQTNHGQTILTSGPRYMSFKENNISDTIEGTWVYINDTSMTGIHQACGMAYTKEGVPGKSRCAVVLVHAAKSNACRCPKKNGINGTCRILFEYHTCEYPPSPSSANISSTVPISLSSPYTSIPPVPSNPSSSNATTTPPAYSVTGQLQTLCQSLNDNNEDMGLRVGLPVGLFILLLMFLLASVFYLKQRWANKVVESKVNPKEEPNEIGDSKMSINYV